MPRLTIPYRDEAERLALEQAIAYLTDLRQTPLDAPNGSALDACEQLALDKGRALLRSTRAAALPARIDATERKGGTRASARGRTPASPRAGTGAPS
jgi:hypothetical protein